MTTIKLNFSSSSNLAVPVGWNKTGTFNPQTTTGNVISDLLDDAGSSTGVGFRVDSVLANRSGSSAWADADIWGIPRVMWQEAWIPRSSTVNGIVSFFGFSVGQSGTMTVAGHANVDRDTDYFLNGGTANRYNATAKPPAEPIVIPFTADSSGVVSISTNYLSTFSYLSFIILEFTESAAATITDIDDLVSGQPFNLTFSDAGYMATSLTVSDGATQKAVALTLVSGATYTGTMPQITLGETALLSGSVTAVATDGTNPTAGVTTSYSISIQHPDSETISPLTQVQFVSISPDSLSVIYEFDPQSQVDDWGLYDSTRFTLSNTCEATGDYIGQTYFFFIATADRIARRFTLDTSGEPPEPGGGGSLTSTGLTSIGLTSTGPTSVGL
jgi:hypothetical protein